MREFVMALLIAGAAAVLTPMRVAASPTVAIHWGECPFPANDPTNRDAGTGPKETVTVTVTGLSGPVRGAQVWLIFRGEGPLPEAWRYDDAGCEAHRLTMGPGDPSGNCPPLNGANPLEIAKFDHDPLTETGRIVYARAYEGFVADPNVTYTLGRFTFDHSAPDTCSCLEAPVCIRIINATWVDGNVIEVPFVIAREFVTWNDPTNSLSCPYSEAVVAAPGSCSPTPASTMTWGRVKASYR